MSYTPGVDVSRYHCSEAAWADMRITRQSTRQRIAALRCRLDNVELRDLESRRRARSITEPVRWESWKRNGMPRYARSLRKPKLLDEVVTPSGSVAVVCRLVLWSDRSRDTTIT